MTYSAKTLGGTIGLIGGFILFAAVATYYSTNNKKPAVETNENKLDDNRPSLWELNPDFKEQRLSGDEQEGGSRKCRNKRRRSRKTRKPKKSRKGRVRRRTNKR